MMHASHFVDKSVEKRKKKCHFHLNLYDGSRFPKKTGVDQSQRQCSAEMIRDTGPY